MYAKYAPHRRKLLQFTIYFETNGLLGNSYSKYDTFALAGEGEAPVFELLHFRNLPLLIVRFPNSAFFSFLFCIYSTIF